MKFQINLKTKSKFNLVILRLNKFSIRSENSQNPFSADLKLNHPIIWIKGSEENLASIPDYVFCSSIHVLFAYIYIY